MTDNPLILIVDDYLQNVQVLARILESSGYQVAIANNGETALKTAQEIIPDMILLDIMMPDISGYDVCKELKNKPSTQNIPIIFLTARTDPEDVSTGFKAGACDFVNKPFNSLELLSRIRTQLDINKLKKNLKHEKFKSETLLFLLINKKNNDKPQALSSISS